MSRRREGTNAGTATDPGARLRASRGADWRFLLPDPDLGSVACVGPGRKTLLEALRLASVQTTVFEDWPPHLEVPTEYDVVVVTDPTRAALEWAAGQVAPGGRLYVEAYGALGRLRKKGVCGSRSGKGRSLRSPADWTGAIRRLGFVEVEAYWHWPDFESCAEMIPLGSPAALEHFVSRRRTGAVVRLKAAFCRLLVKLAVFEHVVPCFSVVACKLR